MPSALRIKELRDLNDNVIMSDGALGCECHVSCWACDSDKGD